MKQLLLKSLVVAVVFGLAIGFFDSLVWIRNIHKYDPPINTAEAQELARLPVVRDAGKDEAARSTSNPNRVARRRDSLPLFLEGRSREKPCPGLEYSCLCLPWTLEPRFSTGLPNKRCIFLLEYVAERNHLLGSKNLQKAATKPVPWIFLFHPSEFIGRAKNHDSGRRFLPL